MCFVSIFLRFLGWEVVGNRRKDTPDDTREGEGVHSQLVSCWVLWSHAPHPSTNIGRSGALRGA